MIEDSTTEVRKLVDRLMPPSASEEDRVKAEDNFSRFALALYELAKTRAVRRKAKDDVTAIN